MNQLMAMTNEMTMGTREIAELLGKQHSHIKASANYLVSTSAINGGVALTETPYINEQNKQTYFEYRLNKLDSITLVAQNSPQFTAALVKRWDELERAKLSPALPNFNDPVASARAWADAVEQTQKLSKKIELDAPKVQFVERYMSAPETFSFRQVAKKLRIKEVDLRELLIKHKVMYKLGNSWAAYAKHIDAGRLVQVSGVADNDHAYTQSKFTTKGVEWISELIAK